MVLLIFRSRGNVTFRAAQNIGLATGLRLMETLAPFIVGSFSDTSALKHRSMHSLLWYKISRLNKPKFLSASINNCNVYIKLFIIIKYRWEKRTEILHFMLVICFNSRVLFCKFRLSNLLPQSLWNQRQWSSSVFHHWYFFATHFDFRHCTVLDRPIKYDWSDVLPYASILKSVPTKWFVSFFIRHTFV